MSESLVQVPGWREIPWLRHGFSTRLGGVSTVYSADGDLNTGWTETDDPEKVAANRRLLIAAAEASEESLVTLRQVHSARSLVVADSREEFTTAEGRAAFEADGLMTKFPGHLLGMQTADCVPVLVVDIERRVVAAFHAGWRGTVAGIVEQGIVQMAAEYGSRSEDLVAAVGPSIGACCYSVGPEVREAFSERFPYTEELFEAREQMYLDLWEGNRRQLLGAGVPAERISVIAECSGCAGLPGRRKYFSHRCENGFTGRMMSVIGIASPG